MKNKTPGQGHVCGLKKLIKLTSVVRKSSYYAKKAKQKQLQIQSKHRDAQSTQK